MDKTKNIYQKLLEVRKTVPYLKKEKEGYQFKYVSSSQTLGALISEMNKQGLLLVPSVNGTRIKTGEKQMLTELDMTFTWINVDNPEEKIICPWYGQGLDTGEKGVGKAMTYAEKYFLLKFFNIATDKDDPDSFQQQTKPQPQTTSTKPATQQSQPAQDKNVISQKQVGRFFGKGKEFGWATEELKTLIKAFGYEHTKDIKRDDYVKIIEMIEKGIPGLDKTQEDRIADLEAETKKNVDNAAESVASLNTPTQEGDLI